MVQGNPPELIRQCLSNMRQDDLFLGRTRSGILLRELIVIGGMLPIKDHRIREDSHGLEYGGQSEQILVSLESELLRHWDYPLSEIRAEYQPGCAPEVLAQPEEPRPIRCVGLEPKPLPQNLADLGSIRINQNDAVPDNPERRVLS